MEANTAGAGDRILTTVSAPSAPLCEPALDPAVGNNPDRRDERERHVGGPGSEERQTYAGDQQQCGDLSLEVGANHLSEATAGADDGALKNQPRERGGQKHDAVKRRGPGMDGYWPAQPVTTGSRESQNKR